MMGFSGAFGLFTPSVDPNLEHFERVGPDLRRPYLYNSMKHSEWVHKWLQTDFGSKSKISWDSNRLSDV